MRTSSKLVVALALACFAIVAVCPDSVFAKDKATKAVKRMLRGNKKISAQVEIVQETLDDQVIGNQIVIQDTLDAITTKLEECCEPDECPECPEPCQPCPSGEVVVPKTGQRTCFNTSGGVIPCAGTGQDGEYQKGTPWPYPRFTDHGNGTVTDNMTGLIWLKNANCFGVRDWATALADCNGLAAPQCEVSDGSGAGDWRLPNVNELQSLVHRLLGNPAISDTLGTGQWSEGDPFSSVRSDWYWTSTTHPWSTGHAWIIRMGYGLMNCNDPKSFDYRVWPVRGPE